MSSRTSSAFGFARVCRTRLTAIPGISPETSGRLAAAPGKRRPTYFCCRTPGPARRTGRSLLMDHGAFHIVVADARLRQAPARRVLVLVGEVRSSTSIWSAASSQLLGSLAAPGGWATCGLPCGPQPDTRQRVRHRGEGERPQRDRPLPRASPRRRGLAVTKRVEGCGCGAGGHRPCRGQHRERYSGTGSVRAAGAGGAGPGVGSATRRRGA